MIGIALIIVAVLIVAIWILVEVQRMKHRVLAFILIGLILFSYLSFALVLKDENINFKSVSGILKAGKVYFVWLGGIFGNIKTMTAHAINLDWQSSEKTFSKDKKNK